MQRHIFHIALIALLSSGYFGANAQTLNPNIVTYDDKLMQIAKQLPGFAGMFLDERGVFTIRMTNADWLMKSAKPAEEIAKTAAVISAVMGENLIAHAQLSRPDAKSKEIVLRQSEFGFAQMFEWNKSLAFLLDDPDVITIDINETRNRITIGVAPNAIEKIAIRAQSAGVPKEAILVYPDENFVTGSTLRSEFRPVPAGVQIEADTGKFDNSICTLGFNVLRNNKRGFVTNAHCTTNRGVSNDTDFHQPRDPWYTEDYKIGDEDADPPFFTGFGCPQLSKCRFSDSAYVDYSVNSSLGAIARPVDSLGSLTIDSVNSRFRIVAETPEVIEGMIVSKVGRTTGWTFGLVTRVCEPQSQGGGFRLLCQATVNRLSGDNPLFDHGDSGSPVFLHLGGQNEISLAGLGWGFNPRTKSSFSFSKLGLIKQELGAMTTFALSTPPAPPGSPPTRAECLADCETDRDACLAEGGLASQCLPRYNACIAACPAQ